VCPPSSQKRSLRVSSPVLDCGAEFFGDDLASYRNSSISCPSTILHLLVAGCFMKGLEGSCHERKIKYEWFGGRPTVGGRPGSRAPWDPLNPAMLHVLRPDFDL